MSEPSGEFCFVLKTTPFRDRDLIASLFSEKRGRFSAIARNGISSKRFGGSLGLFAGSYFEMDLKSLHFSEISQDALVQLISGQIKYESDSLRKSFEKLSAASVLNELILRVTPDQRAVPEVFKLYWNALLALEALPDERAISLVNAFILKLTQWLGVQPSLTRCSSCSKALNEIQGDKVYPVLDKGAWACETCNPNKIGKENLSKMVLLDAYHSMLYPIRKIEFLASQEDHESLLNYLERHLQFFVPGLDKAKIETLRFLRRQDFLNG